eukprot:gene17344-3700_t
MLAGDDDHDGGPWKLWANDVGHDTKLSQILQKSDCYMIVGNPYCGTQQAEMNLCNKTWNDEGVAKYGQKHA